MLTVQQVVEIEVQPDREELALAECESAKVARGLAEEANRMCLAALDGDQAELAAGWLLVVNGLAQVALGHWHAARRVSPVSQATDTAKRHADVIVECVHRLGQAARRD